MSEKKDCKPLNDEILTGMSIEELEDKLEMQLLGATPLAAPEIRRFTEFVIESV